MASLTPLILTPLFTALLVLLVPGNYRVVVRALAVVGSGLTAWLAVLAFFGFHPGQEGLQFESTVPWIHVGTRMQLLSAGKIGDELTARAKVIGNYDKKGHRFVELDALVLGSGIPLAHCWHIAITQPREQAAA
jgi:hypothetical protein